MSADEKLNADKKLKTDEKQEESFQGLHSGVTEKILGVFVDVYNELGGGFLESVYHKALRIVYRRPGFELLLKFRCRFIFVGRLWEFFEPIWL